MVGTGYIADLVMINYSHVTRVRNINVTFNKQPDSHQTMPDTGK